MRGREIVGWPHEIGDGDEAVEICYEIQNKTMVILANTKLSAWGADFEGRRSLTPTYELWLKHNRKENDSAAENGIELIYMAYD
jgi:hypothetical protein